MSSPGPSSPDDATLVRAAQDGDAAGLGVLLERHRARLHAVAVRMLGHGPDADDAVQDTILIALRRIGDLRDPDAAGGWLAAILVNVCRAHLRRPTHERPDTNAVEAVGGIDTVQEVIERAALRDWVWTALERLPNPSASQSCCATSAPPTPTPRSPPALLLQSVGRPRSRG